MSIFRSISNPGFVNRFLKFFSVYSSVRFLNQLIPFILVPILTRFLSPKDYGILATFIAITGVVTVIINMGSSSAITRACVEKKENIDFPQYVFNAIFINLILSLNTMVIMFFLGGFVEKTFHVPNNWTMLIPLMGISFCIFTIYAKILVFKQKPFSYAILRLSNTFLETILSVFFIVVLVWGWKGRIAGIAITRFIFLILSILFLFRGHFLKVSFEFQYIKDILWYNIPVLFHSLGIVLISAIDRFFLNWIVGLGATGIYSVGYSVSSIISILVGAISLAWMPLFYEKLSNITTSVRYKLVKVTYLGFVLIIMMAILLIIISPFLLKIFVGKNFHSALQFIPWLSLGWGIHGMYTLIVGYIFYMKKTYLLSITAFIVVLMNAIFNYTFIKLNGPIGAAQATFFTFLIKFALVWYFANRIYPMPWFLFLKKTTEISQ